jgi:hypothetical protein
LNATTRKAGLGRSVERFFRNYQEAFLRFSIIGARALPNVHRLLWTLSIVSGQPSYRLSDFLGMRLFFQDSNTEIEGLSRMSKQVLSKH